MSIVVQYAPYHLKGGWTDAARRQLADSVLGRLEAFAPGLRSLILAQDVLTPADIERETGAAGGHWHHGELAVDQILSLRPVNGLARSRSEERRVGNECVSTCGSRWAPDYLKKKTHTTR